MADATSTSGGAKRVFIRVAVGALLGFVTWSVSGPQVISWWYEPPSKDAFSCAPSVRVALGQFVYSQLAAAAAGAVLVAIVAGLVRRWWTKRGEANVPAVAPVASAPPPEPPPSVT